MKNQSRRVCLRNLCLLLWYFSLTACYTYQAPGSGGPPNSVVFDNGVAVLGVVSAVKPLTGFERKELTNKLEAQIRAHQSSMTVLPHNELRRYLRGDDVSVQDRHQILMGQYKLYGELTRANMAMIRQTPLPARYVLLARIENNSTQRRRKTNNLVRNSRGELLSDRSEVTLISERTVQVSAKTYDTLTGRLVWSQTYTSKPQATRTFTKYTGSSIVGSAAISLANSFVRGRTSSEFPDYPRKSDAVLATFRRIGEQMFDR